MSDIWTSSLNNIFNKEKNPQKSFPDNLKPMDVKPVFNKEEVSLLKKAIGL